MKVFQLFARFFGKQCPPQQAAAQEPPKQIEIHKLSFRPAPGNATRTFRSRPVRGNAA